MNAEELKTLAQDILTNKVFTDRHCRELQDLPLVFMPLALMTKEQAESTLGDVGMIYEYYDKAAPVGVNGLPVFMSFQKLTLAEAKQCSEFYKELKAKLVA